MTQTAQTWLRSAEEQLQDHLAILDQALAVRVDHHSFLRLG